MLIRELQDFRVEFSPAGQLTFTARSGRHDNLVLALAIAVWLAAGGGSPDRGFSEATRRRVVRGRRAQLKPGIPNPLGHWLEYDEAASQDAEQKVRAFLARHPARAASGMPAAK